MFSQSVYGVVDELMKAIGLATVLYPLERIQSIRQIQSTYSDSELKHHKFIKTRAIHNGLRTYFRGYMPFISKLSILNISSKLTEFGMNSKAEYQKGLEVLNLGFSTVGYFLTYPFEIVSLRMSAEVERERFYISTRQCISKIKKTEGIKTLYRGFFWGYTIFALQFSFLQYLQTNYMRYLIALTQWQKTAAIFGAIGASELLLYPLISLKKIYQINGSIGHTDENYSIRTALRLSKFRDLWRGFEVRLTNILIYSLLYFIYTDQDSSAAQ